MPVLVTGGSGMLGRALRLRFPDALFPSRAELDVTLPETIERYLEGRDVAAVVHAAALTDAALCESDHALALKVNVEGTAAILSAVRKRSPDCYFLVVSTAGVFPCDRGGYHEHSTKGPVNFYCRTKLQAEEIVLRETNCCVVRTNFIRRGKWPHPRAFVDRFGTFLYDTGVAKGIKDLVERRFDGPVHLCGDRKMSLFEAARRTDPDVGHMSLSDYQGPPLPVDMSLITRRWKTYSLKD